MMAKMITIMIMDTPMLVRSMWPSRPFLTRCSAQRMCPASDHALCRSDDSVVIRTL